MDSRASHARNRAQVWRDKSITGVEVISFRLTTHTFRPHTHDTLMFGLIETGSKSFERQGRTYTAPPGSISIVNAGDVHTGRRHSGPELVYQALYIPESYFYEASGEGHRTYAPYFEAAVIRDAELLRALQSFVGSVCEQAPRLVRESSMEAAIALLTDRYGDVKSQRAIGEIREPNAVRQARDMIAARYAEELSIGDIAAASRLNRFHLMHAFRQHWGLPMHAYQLQLRVEHAKARLAAGEPVIQVALAVGFADQSHFTKRFVALVGVTPAVYRSRTYGVDRPPLPESAFCDG